MEKNKKGPDGMGINPPEDSVTLEKQNEVWGNAERLKTPITKLMVPKTRLTAVSATKTTKATPTTATAKVSTDSLNFIMHFCDCMDKYYFHNPSFRLARQIFAINLIMV